MKALLEMLADDFAEQKVMTTKVDGVDIDMLKELWKAHALEVLRFAVPKLIDDSGETPEVES